MGTLWQDIRYGIQMLLKKPGFTAAAVIALAVGIGVNAGMFSAFNAMLLHPLPFPDLDRIVAIYERIPSQGNDRNEASPANYLDWRNQTQSFENVALYSWWGANLTDGGMPERVQGFLLSANMLDALGTKPVLGRGFLPDEDTPGKDQVVLLSYGLWQRRFGADPNIVGKTIAVNSVSRTVIGVMPANYKFPRGGEVFAPLTFTPTDAANRGNHSFLCVAKLKSGVSIRQAQAELDGLSARLEKQYPQTNTGRGARVITLVEDSVRQAKIGIIIMMGAVAFVLLIGCANVANLMLARATGRAKEIAIRAALGATRWRIIRQLLTESIILSLTGGAFGILIGYWTISLMKSSMPAEIIPFISNWEGFRLDPTVLIFTVSLSVISGVLFGLAPALQMSRPDLNDTLKDGGGKATAGGGRHLMRGLLVISEIALSLVLLVGAGLMMKGFMTILKTDPGLKAENVLTMNLVLPVAKYAEGPSRGVFFDELTKRVKALPGVETAGVVNQLPLAGSNSSSDFLVEGVPDPPPGQEFEGRYRVCTPDYFQALGIRLTRGRPFNDRDKADSQPVVIVNETLTKTFWPNQDPIGKRIRFPGALESNPWRTVVGVIADVKHDMEIPVTSEYYLPLAQDPWTTGVLVARTKVDPMSMAKAIRNEVFALDKEQPVFGIKTMEEVQLQSVFFLQISSRWLGAFSGLALLLAAVGIYSVMSYAVSQRTHEIGIRIALGATSSDVLKLVISKGMILTAIGIGIGMAGSLLVTWVLSGFVYGVHAIEIPTFTGVSLLLILVSLLASYVPARRAINVDPMVALRYE